MKPRPHLTAPACRIARPGNASRLISGLLGGALLAAGSVGCRSQPAGELVVATDSNGAITLTEIDRVLIGPGADLRAPGADLDQVFRTTARRIAAERILLDEAQLVGADQSQEFLARQRAILRTAHTEAHLSQSAAARQPLDDAALREEWERRRAQFERPERRIVSQIFLRFRDGEDRQATRQRADDARRRIVEGENFAQVAREVSDSETRHDGGRLGAVERGRFSRDFDELIFALDQGELSRVVLTRDGAHLFLVEQILEQRQPTFEEVSVLLARDLLQQRRRDLLRDAVAALPSDDVARILPAERLTAVMRSGRGDAALAEVGSQQLTTRQLREQVEEAQRRLGAQVPKGLVFLIAEEWFLRERLYQHLEREGLPEIDDELLAASSRQQLADFYTRQRLESWIGERTDEVQTFFELNQARFAKPPRLRLSLLRVDLGSDPVARMTELERAIERLDRSELRLEDLAARLHGELDEWPLLAAGAIGRRNPSVLRFATVLAEGEHAPPFQTEEQIVVLRLDERIDAVPQPLSTVRPQVVQAMLEAQGPQLLQRMFDELLDESGFELDDKALQAAARRLGTGGQ